VSAVLPGRSGLALLVTLAAAVTACSSTAGEGAPPSRPTASPVVVASYDFTENETLAEVYAESIRQAGIPVQVQHGIGTREVVQPALEQGFVDVVVDYLGTAVRFVHPGDAPTARTSVELHDELTTALAPDGVSVLDASAAEDQNGFAVLTGVARDRGISRLSDLTAIAPELVLGAPPECPQRPLCLPGLARVYGLDFADVRSMTSRAATVEALIAGEIDVGLLETTDGRLATAPLTMLADDRGLQPPEGVVPLVRTAVLDARGDRLRSALNAVSARLTTPDLIELNRAVEVDGLTPDVAAARWWKTG
jgi:osmoprotectant transport system substrate-binding protein